ncbi:8358_t:CDS:2 [Cetraspora pellucida]|uniref:8358_t:CDS:1 n=1 Tax=Cetraspora pellucida TaxID=1433469 RepID=A0ACA9LAN4_9GLOM|nr:8358_t:CDS:2 [Cetraspora pellucida]
MDTSGDNDGNSGEDQSSLFNENIADDLLEFETEKGIVKDPTSLTFSINGEDHTLGNALRYVITLNPEVEYCGYSIPHPSEDKLNIRIQTTDIKKIMWSTSALLLNMLLIRTSERPTRLEANKKYIKAYNNIENTTAIEAMRKGLEDLKIICDHIKETFIRSNRQFDFQQ